MRQFFIPALVLVSLVACDGHNLDSPISTCQTITGTLSGDQAIVWHKSTEAESGSEKRVTLELSLVGQEQNIAQIVCIYGLKNVGGNEINYGEYENVPKTLLINGQAIPELDLIQATNLATFNTAKEVGQDVVARTQEAINRLQQR